MRLSIAIVATLASLAGCAGPERSRPTALPIVGPDGSPMLHVSCGAREGACYQLAGQYCPLGYAISATGSARGNFLVSCRRARTPAAFDVVAKDSLAPSPYVLKETVEPWPPELAPSPYRQGPTSSDPESSYPPLVPGSTGPAEPPPGTPRGSGAGGSSQDLGF